jgi:N-methylhydantoinase B
MMYELRCEHFRLRPDTGGPGRFRGGLGVEKNIRFLCDSVVSARTDRWLFPPAGIARGRAGAPGAYVLNPDQQGERLLASKFAELEVSKGDVISFRTMGGGGYGSPAERDPDLVLDDVRSGRVSTAAAAREYGVVIMTDADGSPGSVDPNATQRLRQELRND